MDGSFHITKGKVLLKYLHFQVSAFSSLNLFTFRYIVLSVMATTLCDHSNYLAKNLGHPEKLWEKALVTIWS